MNLEKLKELGIEIKRGKLEEGFEEGWLISNYKEPNYLSENNHVPRLDMSKEEDLSWMNPRSSKTSKERFKQFYAKMDPKKKKKILAANGAKSKGSVRRTRKG